MAQQEAKIRELAGIIEQRKGEKADAIEIGFDGHYGKIHQLQ